MRVSLLSKSLHLKKSELQFILFFCLRNKEFVLFHHVQDQFWLEYNNYTMPGKSYHSKGIILLFLNNLQYFPIIPPRHRHYSPFHDVIILLYRNLCNTSLLHWLITVVEPLWIYIDSVPYWLFVRKPIKQSNYWYIKSDWTSPCLTVP